MKTKNTNKTVWIVAAVLALGAGAAWQWLQPAAQNNNFVTGNGRIEATEIDVAAKAPGRVQDIMANEGDFVNAGDIVAQMDMKSTEAQLAQARAQVANTISGRETARARLAQRKADVVMAEAVLVQRRSELDLARKTSARSQALRADRAISEQIADDNAARVRNSEASVNVASAQITAAQAAVRAAEAEIDQSVAAIEAANAVVVRLQTELEDGALRAPRNGRVQYRVVQPGEVVAGGGKILSLVDIGDV